MKTTPPQPSAPSGASSSNSNYSGDSLAPTTFITGDFDANLDYQWHFLRTTAGITGFDADAFVTGSECTERQL